MRTSRLVLVLVALLLASTSTAQNWFGVRSGYPLGVTLHYGMANALGGGADLRISGRVVASGGSTSIGVGADALWRVYMDGPVRAYVGAGPTLGFGSGSANLGVQGLVGGEFRFRDFGLPRLGLFLEGSVGATISLSGGSARIPDFNAAFGFNWWF